MKTVLTALALLAAQPSQAPGPSESNPLAGYLRATCEVSMSLADEIMGALKDEIQDAAKVGLSEGGLQVLSNEAMSKLWAMDGGIILDGKPDSQAKNKPGLDKYARRVIIRVNAGANQGGRRAMSVTAVAERYVWFYNGEGAALPIYSHTIPIIVTPDGKTSNRLILETVKKASRTLAKKAVEDTLKP